MIKKVITAYRTSFMGLSRETWLLAMVILINRCGFMAVPFMSLYVTQHLGRSLFDAGVISTLFGIGSIAGAAAGGQFTQKVGYRPVQIITSIVAGSLFLVFGFVTDFSTLCILSLVISFFTEAFRPANFTATVAYAREGTVTRSYSLNRLAMNLGWAVGTGIGGILASLDYRLIFVVDGSINIIAGLTIWWLLPSTKSIVKKVQQRANKFVSRKPWQDPIFLRFLLITTVYAACFFLMFRVAPVFFKDKWAMKELLIGMILGLNGVIIALFEMVMINKIESLRPPLFYAVVGAVFTALSFLFLILPPELAIAGAGMSMILFTVGEMFALPFINTFVISRTDEHNRGQYAAGYTMSWSVAQVIGPAGGFYLVELAGYETLWILLFVMLCICAVAYSILNKKTKPQEALVTS